ncbi:MAG: CRISPR locus-related DNA-binding protein [Candidatus Aenigmarchaeota archaeon]|nr:CRISPR locus-related DNA-binding protein [Candidatus Aenigmarchaeota archaeon]
MPCVLITTVYSSESIVLSITRLSPDRLYLLLDKKPDEVQKKTTEIIKSTFGPVIEVKEKNVELYDFVSVAKTIVDLLDDISRKDEVYVNITPGRKTQAIGVLFGCYARPQYVKKIFYIPEGSKDIITLPILSFDISTSQKEILDSIEKIDTPKALADEVETSRAMLYRNIKDLADRGFIEPKPSGEGGGYKLTDAGKIARL